MLDEIKLAIIKGLGAAPVLKPGTYQIEETVTLHIRGSIVKSEPTEASPTVSIPLLPTLALVLQKAGFQRENMKAIIIEAMQTALDLEKEGKEKGKEAIKPYIKDFEEAEKHVKAILKALPKVPREGPTKVTVFVDEVITTPV